MNGKQYGTVPVLAIISVWGEYEMKYEELESEFSLNKYIRINSLYVEHVFGTINWFPSYIRW